MSIWHLLSGPFNWLSFFCNILVFVIPFTIYHINNRLHDYADPIWKKNDSFKKE